MRILYPSFCLLITTNFFSYTAFAGNENNKNENNQMQSTPISSDLVLNVNVNPLLPEWTGQYGGVPPFDKIEVSYFKPALEAAMTDNLNEIEKITSNPAAPTFENTIAEMERSGKILDRVRTVYGIWSSNMSNSEFESVETEMEPKLAAFSDKITQNEKLFQRIEAIYISPTKKNLTSEQQRLTVRRGPSPAGHPRLPAPRSRKGFRAAVPACPPAPCRPAAPCLPAWLPRWLPEWPLAGPGRC